MSANLSDRKQLAEAYFEGFRRSEHAQILALLTDDVRWDLPGYKQLQGKAAFDAEIEGEGTTGPPDLRLDRLVEEGDTVVALGTGTGLLVSGDQFQFAFCTVLTFTGALISRVESYIVPLSTQPA